MHIIPHFHVKINDEIEIILVNKKNLYTHQKGDLISLPVVDSFFDPNASHTKHWKPIFKNVLLKKELKLAFQNFACNAYAMR